MSNASYETERMVMPSDRHEFKPKLSKLVYVVINPWDYTTANVIGVYSKESEAKRVIDDLKRYGDDSGNQCPNVFYECHVID